jgi:thioredoxin reductase (NADPH)
LSPLVLAGDTPGGLLTQTTEVENFPGFPDGITGFDLVMNMQTQAEKFGARIEYETVTSAILNDNGIHRLTLSDGRKIETATVVIATGASPRYLGVPGEDRLRGNGVSACATCDGAFFKGRAVAVAGGGDTALEEADSLSKSASRVTLIHRRDTFRASKIMVERVKQNPLIDILWNTEIKDILGEEKVSGLLLHDLAADRTYELPVDALFVALGHIPATGLFVPPLADTDGFIAVDTPSTATNFAGVFAAGDCSDAHYRQAVTAAASGCRAALDAENYLAAKNGNK